MTTTLENKKDHRVEPSYKIKKKRILIVDDEVGFTNIVKLTLEERNGYEVCAENNPRRAVATALKFTPDIVLLDVIMPEMGGEELYINFMEDPILQRIPIMFLTAIVGQRDIDKHRGWIGGSFYIAKPVSADGLITAIEEHTRS